MTQKKGWVLMIKVNYEYCNKNVLDLKVFEKEIRTIVDDFKNKKCVGNDFIGWYEYPIDLKKEIVSKINSDAEDIRRKSDVFVVCGIGGSYLGSRAVIEAINGFRKGDIEIIYLGNTFDERYTGDILKYLEDKDFCVNVISKSGTTLETAYAFRLLKELLKKKYGKEYSKRIYATTDEVSGCLRQMANEEGYVSYIIPRNVGGRYSVFTPVGLLPIAVAGIDISKFVEGAIKAHEDLKNDKIEENIAYQYASYRYMKYLNGEKVELFVTYSPYLNMIAEWWKQLFGESEGKEGKGLFPASVNFSTDLHSLGQFIQQGSKVLFMTQLKVLEKGCLGIVQSEENLDNLNYLSDITLGEINLKAQEGTNKAHYEIGGIDNFTFEIDCINEFNIGYLLYTYMYSCMISANLLKVNPFDQPGVEFYKQEMKKLLKK